MNEKKTEQLVRSKLTELGYYTDSEITIEEQKSDNPKINKLLKNASKKGNGAGYPEFIITSSKYPDLLIVIECKADIKKHESNDKDKYADYAVDGALLYASFLSKEFDVIAIGISGQNVSELKITHYLQLKTIGNYTTFLGSMVLSFEDYYNNYIKDPVKFNQDYQELLGYSSELNDTLHSKRIKESQRSLLISGVLIALKNQAFKNSFKFQKTAKEITESLVNTVINELIDSEIPKDKVENLKHAYSFIKMQSSLAGDKKFLIELIEDIDSKINSFMETHKYFDTLGQFYIEFLRYANNDKGLGIVLTPPHITELFIDLAEVNKDSVVYDNCCGTGGFLISSLKKMIEDARGDSVKIKAIKKNQIVGVEYQDDIYALAISNMIIHGDGKSNVIPGDCFNNTANVRKKYKPTVGFLNPPYKTQKNDKYEYEFILDNISTLQQNSKCISIIPMSCVLAQKGEEYEYKKKILENNTLESVMSMPDDLFSGVKSNVGAVTCVVVLTVGIAHPKGKKTYFGYWKNDGFEKYKKKGRIDRNNTWQKYKEKWVNGYKNKDIEAGCSVMKEVKAEDEWCAEAYMETDYSTIKEEDFAEVVRNYTLFKLLNE